MPSTSPFPAAPDQRLLAAIVFTDVAGFSRRVQVEESDTLKLLERDFVTMRAFAAMHSGRVIKSTGDGLLLFFTSAVHAVEWALRTQRHFADQAAMLPAEEVLRHRVGVHLGDVFVGAGDVMGDGVNIAARLQAEAPPGGICISQVVYGVVKNKLKLDVVRLEPRQLKNIKEPIQIYRLLLEPPVQSMQAIQPQTESAAPAPVQEPFSGARRFAVIALIVLGAGVAAALLVQAHFKHQRDITGSQEVRDALAAAARLEKTAAPRNTEAEATTSTGMVPVTETAVRVAPEQFDFAKLTASRPSGAPTTEEDRRILQAANECLPALNAWTAAALQRYTRDGPLHVPPLRNVRFQSSTLFTDSDRQLYFVQGGASRKQNWQDLTSEVRGAIVASLLRSSPVPPPPEVMRGAEAFAFVHRLPEMAAILLRERRAP